MAVVAAFGTLSNTTHAGLTAYFRATGCTSLTIADVIPLFSKITAYEQEYVIGEMKIWDSGIEASEPNNCAMCRVMVYNDGWIVAWFDKESQNQETSGACTFIDAQTLGNVGSITTEYPDKYNGCRLKVISSSPTDSECPDGTIFCIRNTNLILNQIQVHADYSENYNIVNAHFNTGHTYAVEIYQDNGNLVWWGHNSDTYTPLPTNMSNRLYRAIYEMWELLKDNSNSTAGSPNLITKAYLFDSPSGYTDYTSQVNNTTIGDFYLLPSTEAVNDAFYWGHWTPFSGINITMYEYGIGNTIIWEYWNGSAWVVIPGIIDTTNGYTIEGNVRFTSPVDWAKCDVNSSEQYWIRSRCTSSGYTTQPRGTQAWLISIPYTLEYTDTNLGMYSFEDTSANYCLLCGVNEHTVYSGIDDVHFYNTSLPGKIIYKHSISCGGWARAISSKINFYINDAIILRMYDSYMDHSNGYIIFNIKTIAGTIAVQNVFNCYGESIANYRYTYGNMASVMITG